MPVAPTYPGVYIEEVPSGIHPIAGVPTAIAAFIGWFPRGTMKQAFQVLSFADVEREFGGLHRDSDTSFALSQFFLNGGARAWVVRVAAPGSTTSTTTALGLASASVPAETGGGNAFTVTAINQGVWGNAIRVQIAGPYGMPERFDLIVSVVGTVGGRAAIAQQEVFPGLTATDVNDPNYVATVVNAGSSLVSISPAGSAATLTTPAGSGVRSGASAPALTRSSPQTLGVTIGGRTETVTIPGTIATLEEIAAAIQSVIRTARGSDPSWSQATVKVLAGTATGDTGRLQILSGLGDVNTVSVADSGGTAASSLFLTTTATSPATSRPGAIALSGGGDGNHPGAAEIVGSQSAGTGMYALDNTDFTLLCLPSIANQKDSDVDGLRAAEYSAVVGNAIEYCRQKRAMVLLDPPDTIGKPATMQGWISSNSSVRDDYSAIYYPRTSIADPTRNYTLRSVGPSGTIAGLMARIDAARGVWKAPAGTEATLRGLAQLDYDLTDAENGILNPIAVNCLRSFDAYGMVCWGARTLNGSDGTSTDYRYVPVRRLANFLESSLYIGLKWVVFEPNDEPLWSQIRVNVQSFLQGLFLQGAFAGRTPKEAYLVKCDSTTTSPTDQALGVVNVVVGFAPVRPAEFVILRIQQLAGQTQS